MELLKNYIFEINPIFYFKMYFKIARFSLNHFNSKTLKQNELFVISN